MSVGVSEEGGALDAGYWQLHSQLESGRAEVLRKVAEGAELAEVLNLLCAKAEDYNPLMMCSVLRLNAEESTLHPCASGSLPDSYCAALDGVRIGKGVGSCGTAAFQRQRVVVEDINTHPYWAQYKDLALGAGLQACWSEPIIGRGGKVFGTFAMYYAQPTTPNDEDLKFIETNASLAAVVFENNLAQQHLVEANNLLSQTVDQRTEQLIRVNQELSDLLVKQTIEGRQNVDAERAQTTKKLLSGFAHEVNTPIGVSMTSASFAKDIAIELVKDIGNGKLTKNGALESLKGIRESIELCEESLNKTSNLIAQFREIDIDSAQNTDNVFCINEFLDDLVHAVTARAPEITFKFECESGLQSHSKTAFWQLFNQLIDNSLEHGFENSAAGTISIHVARSQTAALGECIVINYQDDGVGISGEEQADIFEPFFSTQRGVGKVGLGLNVISNTISSVFNGEIKLVPSPVGVRYEIDLPIVNT